MRAKTCVKCGEQPWIIKEPDGYWYVGCTIQCNSEAEWDKDKTQAILKWNESQELKASAPMAESKEDK